MKCPIKQGSTHHKISGAVITGNTTMLHFLTGLDPEGIAGRPVYPAEPVRWILWRTPARSLHGGGRLSAESDLGLSRRGYRMRRAFLLSSETKIKPFYRYRDKRGNAADKRRKNPGLFRGRRSRVRGCRHFLRDDRRFPVPSTKSGRTGKP